MTLQRRSFWAIIMAGGVFLFGFNLRPAITTVGPVLSHIGETYGLNESLLGLLGSLPLIMFSAVSLVTSALTKRLGVDRAALIILVLIAGGIAVRSLAGPAGLWLGTMIAAGAIAVGNVIATVLVRRDFERHTALATGVFTAVMGIGAATGSAVAAPLAQTWGWESSLLLWAGPALVVGLVWLARLRHPEGAARVAIGAPVTVAPVWRSSAAWWLTLFMGLQSSVFYFLITWLPTISIIRGSTIEGSGVHLFWYQVWGFTGGFLVPLLMRSHARPLGALLGSSVPALVGFIGLLSLPDMMPLWITVLGVGSGMSLVVSLALVSARGVDAVHTTKLSSMVQSGGYLIAALTPLMAGVLMQHAGDYRWSLIMMSGVACAQVVVALMVARER